MKSHIQRAFRYIRWRASRIIAAAGTGSLKTRRRQLLGNLEADENLT